MHLACLVRMHLGEKGVGGRDTHYQAEGAGRSQQEPLGEPRRADPSPVLEDMGSQLPVLPGNTRSSPLRPEVRAKHGVGEAIFFQFLHRQWWGLK